MVQTGEATNDSDRPVIKTSQLSIGLAERQELNANRTDIYRLRRTDAEILVRHLEHDCMGYTDDGRRVTMLLIELAAWLDETSGE